MNENEVAQLGHEVADYLGAIGLDINGSGADFDIYMVRKDRPATVSVTLQADAETCRTTIRCGASLCLWIENDSAFEIAEWIAGSLMKWNYRSNSCNR